jgi:hypothetical protein
LEEKIVKHPITASHKSTIEPGQSSSGKPKSGTVFTTDSSKDPTSEPQPPKEEQIHPQNGPASKEFQGN